MRKLFTIALAGITVLSLGACSSQSQTTTATTETTTAVQTTEAAADTTETAPDTVTITHSLGELEVPYDPQRVAILDMSVLDMMDNWNLGDRVVGMPKQSEVGYLMSYNENENIEHLGSLKEVDMEALNSLEPDIIFIGGRLSAEYENLSKIAPTVLLTIDNANGYMNGFKQNVQTVASIFGMDHEAEALIADFDTRLTALKEAASGKTAIVGMVTSGSFNTLGNDGRCSMISNEVGFNNLANDVTSTHGDASSFELILDKNPDYLFVLDRDAAINAEGSKTAQEIMENELVMKTDAYKNGHVVYLTSDVWYLAEGGITATDTMIQDLENGLLAN